MLPLLDELAEGGERNVEGGTNVGTGDTVDIEGGLLVEGGEGEPFGGDGREPREEDLFGGWAIDREGGE